MSPRRSRHFPIIEADIGLGLLDPGGRLVARRPELVGLELRDQIALADDRLLPHRQTG